VCISGENVSEDDARALGDLISDTPVRLDLIDVTDATGRFNPPLDWIYLVTVDGRPTQ